MNRLPLSCFIIAKNEADRIVRTIRAVKDWAGEIVVIDSGSTDGTQALAEAEGARVIFNAWPGFGQQKRFGETQCRNEWLINLDADEVVSPKLAAEIQALFGRGEPALAVYALRSTMSIRDNRSRGCGPTTMSSRGFTTGGACGSRIRRCTIRLRRRA